jgi:hypothetical protein
LGWISRNRNCNHRGDAEDDVWAGSAETEIVNEIIWENLDVHDVWVRPAEAEIVNDLEEDDVRICAAEAEIVNDFIIFGRRIRCTCGRP